jgi:hypothetical protein
MKNASRYFQGMPGMKFGLQPSAGHNPFRTVKKEV